MTDTLRLHPDDSVVVALRALKPGEALEGVTVADRVPRGHKLATRPHRFGEPVVKYGQIMGAATAEIAAGAHVHSHNCGMRDFARDYAFGVDARAPEPVEPETFDGFLRETGQVGTRNYLGVLTSVNCSASVARFIAEAAERDGFLANFPNVDGVVPLVHSTGCGMDANGEGFEILQRTLHGYAHHPNFAGVLMVGLGCEVMTAPKIAADPALRASPRFRQMTIQGTGGARKTVETGVAILREMAVEADRARRTPQPMSELTLALQCGGSDAYSGITANPALGWASDRLVAMGGTTILAETPEIYGAEHLLTRRAASREVGEKLVSRIRWWEDYTARNHGEMDNNPSPGNKQGGLTTILEKSLGAVAKGGSAPLADVLLYGERAGTRGFLFMDSPGYDPCSVTGQVASGATVVAFTTGRGSVFGFKPSPSIKLATNSQVYQSMTEDMDVNCGDILEGADIAAKGREILDLVRAVASGAPSKSEAQEFGASEFIPWQVGAVM